MNPRVLFVDHVGVLGGAELSLLDIARHFQDTCRVLLFEDGPFRVCLQEAGVSVEVIAAPATLNRVARGGGVMQDLRALPGVLTQARAVARRARRYDVIYANSQKSMAVAALAGKMAGKPVIWHLRDLMTTDHFSRMHCRVATFLANRFVTRVIANSNATQGAFIRQGGIAGRVFTVYNGVSNAPFGAVTAAGVDRLRHELRLNGEPLVGVFSRLARWKGQHVLLEALGDLPGVHALLVGDALFKEDASYAEALHRQADQLGIAERVHFLGFRRDVPRLLALVDVVVHTSIAPEPFGRVIIEGMLATKPVVATRAGGVPEIVEEDKTGLLVPPGNPRALAAALARLFDEPEAARLMAHAGQQAAQERFSVEGMLEAVAKNIREVVARR